MRQLARSITRLGLIAGVIAVSFHLATAQATRRAAQRSAANRRIVLKAVVQPGLRVPETDFARSVVIMRERLRQLGIRATVTQPRRSLLVVIDLLDANLTNRFPPAVSEPGVIEFYDLEADLARPSTGPRGVPVASTKRLSPRPNTALVTCGTTS